MGRKINRAVILAVAGVLAVSSSVLYAESLPLEIFTNNSKFYSDPGLDFHVDVVQVGSDKVGFQVYNNSKINSSIIGIYFDGDDVLGNITNIINDPWKTFFVKDTMPKNLPGFEKLNPDFETTQSARIIFPLFSAMGVNPGENVEIVFGLNDGHSYGDVIDGLGNGSLRIGAHITGIGKYWCGGCESAVTIPEPATLALLAIGGLMLRKRT